MQAPRVVHKEELFFGHHGPWRQATTGLLRRFGWRRQARRVGKALRGVCGAKGCAWGARGAPDALEARSRPRQACASGGASRRSLPDTTPPAPRCSAHLVPAATQLPFRQRRLTPAARRGTRPPWRLPLQTSRLPQRGTECPHSAACRIAATVVAVIARLCAHCVTLRVPPCSPAGREKVWSLVSP